MSISTPRIRSTAGWVAVGWIISILSTWPNSVFADDEPMDEAQQEEAAALVTQAGEARAARRLTEARDLLERSLELHARAPTAFNLALVLMEMGRHLRAVELLDSLGQGQFGELPSERLGAVATLVTQARGSLASLRLLGRGAGEAQARLDGLAVGRLVSGTPIEREVDPGTHVVSLSVLHRDGPVERSVDLAPGERRELDFDLSPSPRAALAEAPASAPPPDSSGSVWESPIFWAIVGAVVVAAGAVSVALVLTGRDPEQVVDPVLGNREVLRFSL